MQINLSKHLQKYANNKNIQKKNRTSTAIKRNKFMPAKPQRWRKMWLWKSAESKKPTKIKVSRSYNKNNKTTAHAHTLTPTSC